MNIVSAHENEKPREKVMVYTSSVDINLKMFHTYQDIPGLRRADLRP